MKNIHSIFILFLFIVSCDPCDDCDTVAFEPTISFVFINQDSISAINDSLAIISFNDSSLTSNIEILDTLRSRLEEVQVGIDTGNTSLQAEKDLILTLIPERQADSLLFEIKNEDADSITNVLNNTKATINSGLLLVNEIAIPEVSYIQSYQDSATSWTVPLSFEGEFTEYDVTIADIMETIELSYDNFQDVDEERNVLIRAENIRVVDKTYIEIDSVKSNCEETCIDGEAVFTFYF